MEFAPRLADEAIGAMDKRGVFSTPQGKQERAVLEAFYKRYYTDSAFAPVAAVYARLFTAAELQQLIAFYGSAVGKKLMDARPAIAEAQAAATAGLRQAHQAELDSRFRAARRRH